MAGRRLTGSGMGPPDGQVSGVEPEPADGIGWGYAAKRWGKETGEAVSEEIVHRRTSKVERGCGVYWITYVLLLPQMKAPSEQRASSVPRFGCPFPNFLSGEICFFVLLSFAVWANFYWR